MKIILHGTSREDGLNILALRAALSMLDSKPGEVSGLLYDDGSMYSVRRNKQSISVWKQD